MEFIFSVLLILIIIGIIWIIRNYLYKGIKESFRGSGWRREPPYGWPGWYRGRWDKHGSDFWRRGWNPVVVWSVWPGWWPERTWVYDGDWARPWDWITGDIGVQKPWMYQREGFSESRPLHTDTTDIKTNKTNKTSNIEPNKNFGAGSEVDLNNEVYEFPPNSPEKADIYSLDKPSRLIKKNDTCMPETISGVTSRSCYASDFQRLIELVGNNSQQTNNYKRESPDSCSAPFHELVLSFYKAHPLAINAAKAL